MPIRAAWQPADQPYSLVFFLTVHADYQTHLKLLVLFILLPEPTADALMRLRKYAHNAIAIFGRDRS